MSFPHSLPGFLILATFSPAQHIHMKHNYSVSYVPSMSFLTIALRLFRLMVLGNSACFIVCSYNGTSGITSIKLTYLYQWWDESSVVGVRKDFSFYKLSVTLCICMVSAAVSRWQHHNQVGHGAANFRIIFIHWPCWPGPSALGKTSDGDHHAKLAYSAASFSWAV